MMKKRYCKKFLNFDGEPIDCEIMSRNGYTELEITYGNLHFAMQFNSEADIVGWCNDIKALAIEKMNEC